MCGMSPSIINTDRLAEYLVATNVLVVCTKRSRISLLDYLDIENVEDINIRYIQIPSGEPESKAIDEIFSNIEPSNIPDFILACGGGSVIDTAKLLSILITNGGSLHDYEFDNANIDSQPIKLIAIPTTSGSGSESSIYTVCNNSNTMRKFTVTHPSLVPEYVCLIPELTKTMPRRVTLATALDAFIHAFEGFFSAKPHPVSSSLSIQIMYNIFTYLEKALASPDNIEYRSIIQKSSFNAGIVINLSRTGIIHTFSAALAKFSKLAHGELNACLFEQAISLNRKYYCIDSHDKQMLLKLFDVESIENFLLQIESWIENHNLDLDFTLNDQEMTVVLDRVEQDKGLSTVNPAPLDRKTLSNVLSEIMRT